MSQPAQHIARTRAAITRLCDAAEHLRGCLSEFEWLGSEAVEDHWLDSEGEPRTDLDLSAAEYLAAVQAGGSILTYINSNANLGGPLYRAKG